MAEGRWLAAEMHPDPLVELSTVVVRTEGARVVACFHVDRVLDEAPSWPNTTAAASRQRLQGCAHGTRAVAGWVLRDHVIVSIRACTIVDMDDQPALPPLELRQATTAIGRLVFGDSGVGGTPLGGELALSVDHRRTWHGSVSSSALDAVEDLWGRRKHADHVTEPEALAITKACIDYDLAFYGLTIDWGAAWIQVVADGAAVRFAAPVRWAGLLEVGTRHATVQLELVDRHPTHAEFVLCDGDQIETFAREELEARAHDGPNIDAMSQLCLDSLREHLASLALPSPAHWQMDYSEWPALEGTGSCGALRVWTSFTG